MPSRIHFPVQNTKHCHSLDRDTLVDDVLLKVMGAEIGRDLVS
jgi:hypothetical protein